MVQNYKKGVQIIYSYPRFDSVFLSISLMKFTTEINITKNKKKNNNKFLFVDFTHNII